MVEKGESNSIDLFTDSMGVVSLSRNSVLTSATKHIEIADFYVREQVARGIVTVAHIPTGVMLADVLTKPLAKIKFFRFINAILGVTPIHNDLAVPQWENRAGKLDLDGHQLDWLIRTRLWSVGNVVGDSSIRTDLRLPRLTLQNAQRRRPMQWTEIA